MARSSQNKAAAALFIVPVALILSWAITNCSEDLSSLIPGADTGPESNACTNNAQCGKDKVCVNKVCVSPDALDAGGRTCGSKLECNPGEDCLGGWCVPEGGDAQAGGDGGGDTGLPNGDGMYCTESSACGSGYRCSPDTHSCEPAAIIAVDPAELDFGAVPFGSEVSRTATVRNAGTADLKVLSADFDQGTNPDPQNPVFRKTTSAALPATLKPGEQMTVDVICRQDDAKPDGGGLLITSTDLDRPLSRIPLLSRYKGAPDLAVIDRSVSPPSVLYPKSGSTDEYLVDVGNVAIGGSRETTVTLLNATTGDAILALDKLDVHKKTENEFTIAFRDTADPSKERELPIYLSPGDMVDMIVGYEPLVKTSDERTDLDLHSNDDDVNNDGSGGSSVLFIKLTAKAGWEPGGISVSKANVQFGEVQINTSASDVVRVCNSGGSNLSVLPTSGLQTAQTAFSTAPPTLGKTLAPLECFDITIAFAPTKLGDSANALVLNSDDPGNPSMTIPLAGTGTDPKISLFPKTISFNNTFVGIPANPVNVMVTNTGTGVLTVTAIDLTAGSSSDFKITNKPPQFPVTLHENQADSISFTVEFTATVNGVITGAVQVENSDADDPRAIVDLSANADYAIGHPCNAASECPSTFCTDNVCCNAKCDGMCERCDVAGSVGLCMPVPVGLDPDNECGPDDVSTCGKTGYCSGTRGACELYPKGDVCQTQNCAAGTQTNAKTCNGSGACVAPTPATTDCAPYTCNGSTGCYTSCLTGSECVNLYACSAANECKKGPGMGCLSGADCWSGFCVDGVCCNEQCNANCEACTAAKKGSGADGACGAIALGADPDNDCAVDLPETCGSTGQCSGARGQCERYPASTICSPQTCANGLQSNQKTCSVAGICTAPIPPTVDCSPYGCNGATCYTSCTTGTECETGYACAAGGVCKKAKGQQCGDNAECASGFCVDEVCCNEQCGGLCEACTAAKRGTGADGTCGAVIAGNDPDDDCVQETASTCQKTGNCSGTRGSCELYGNGTVCQPQTCTADLNSSNTARTCNGSGTCQSSTQQNCSPFKCNDSTGLCRTSCAVDGDCQTGYSCSGGVCGKAQGQACTNGLECASHNCVDNVCCNEQCNSPCEACTAAKKGGGSDGICGAVPSAQDPDNDCASEPASTCQKTGSCSGSRGSCALHGNGTVCQAQSCAAGVQTNAKTCDGLGTCNTPNPATTVCSPYVCNGTTGCYTSCTTGAECAAGYACGAGNVCKKADGQTCSAGTECASGFCRDGVCCNELCGGLCEACTATKKGSGTDGTCGAIAEATDPDTECAADGQSTCQRTGFCSGTRGSCDLYSSGTVCQAQTCAAGVQTNAKTCDGVGGCNAPVPPTVTCAPYVCDATACKTSCSGDGDCIANYSCANGVCKKSRGQACGNDNECASGFCTDSLCCEARCFGTCEKCNIAGRQGYCDPVADGADLDNECPDDGVATCDQNGWCSGSRSCKLYANGATCVAAACTGDGNSSNAADLCNGSGTCVDNGVQNCSPYKCNDTTGVCRLSCSGDAHCQTGYTCSGGVCQQSSGTSCTLPSQCASTFCVDGYCCNAACDGTCERCDLAGSIGVCAPIPAGQDPNDECPNDGAASCDRNGSCSGNRSCALYGTSTQCVAPFCTGNTSNLPHMCDGAGNCPEGGTQACAPYVCNTGDGLCKTSCSGAGDCVSGYICSSGQCKKDRGEACGGDTECASGFCTDNVCCETDCNGVCEKCNQAGRLGYCDAVPGGTDPDSECAQDAAATCQKNGNCSGSRTCALYDNNTVCATAYCSGNTSFLADKCNGTGTCTDNGFENCPPYICVTGTGLCKTSCDADADCVAGYDCNTATHVCLKEVGQACTAGTECITGSCCGNVCTDAQTNPDHCGGCSQACSTNHITRSCIAGSCENGTCEAGWGDCLNNKRTDGCETNTAGDVTNCGGCGNNCNGFSWPHVTGYTCSSSQCALTGCSTDWYNQNAPTLSDGCECQDGSPGNKTCATAINIGAGGTCTDVLWNTCYETCYQTCYASQCCNYYYDSSWGCMWIGQHYCGFGDDWCEAPYGCDPYQCNPYQCNPYSCNPYLGNPHACDGVDDDGRTATVSGNIPNAGDAKWYKVNALNTHWDRTTIGALGTMNPFNFRIGFTSNPNDDYQLEVFTNCSGAYAACPDVGSPIHATTSTDMWEYNAASENPCVSPTPVSGQQLCQDHTATLYVKVTRRTAVNCTNFTLKVVNNAAF